MAVEITSREELEAWLEDKPREWAQVIAARCALRVFPFACFIPEVLGGYLAPRFPIRLLRSNTIVSATSVKALGKSRLALIQAMAEIESMTMAMSARTAAADMGLDNRSSEARLAISADMAAMTTHFAASALVAALDGEGYITARETINAAGAAAEAVHARTISEITSPSAYNPASVAYSDAVAEVQLSRTAIWAAISEDCRLLSLEGVSALRLTHLHLWPNAPDWWSDTWDAARHWLSRPEDNFEIWREWYHGRVEGLPHAFGDFDNTADETFYRWIIEQDDGWWTREPREVNADIKTKVEELRKREPGAAEMAAQTDPGYNIGAFDGEGDDTQWNFEVVATLKQTSSPKFTWEGPQLVIKPTKPSPGDSHNERQLLRNRLIRDSGFLFGCVGREAPENLGYAFSTYHQHIRDAEPPDPESLWMYVSVVERLRQNEDYENWAEGIGPATDKFIERHTLYVNGIDGVQERDDSRANLRLNKEVSVGAAIGQFYDQANTVVKRLKEEGFVRDDVIALLQDQLRMLHELNFGPQEPDDPFDHLDLPRKLPRKLSTVANVGGSWLDLRDNLAAGASIVGLSGHPVVHKPLVDLTQGAADRLTKLFTAST